MNRIAELIISRATARMPDVVIGGREHPYLKRWFVIPRNPVFNIYLHQFLRSDDDRAHHTHPWLFNCSVILSGEYIEHVIERGGLLRRIARSDSDVKFRLGASPHRLELINHKPCWTLFITGPRVREWGFFCSDRFVHWKDFTTRDGNDIGRGCEQ